MDKMKDYKEKIFSLIDLNNKINSYDEDSQNINMVNEDSSKKQNINMGNEDSSKKQNINMGNIDSSENALVCKVILLGGYNVGKTKIIDSFLESNFEDSTTGASYAAKTIFFKEENQSIKFEIWDTAGQEKYRSLLKIFYKNSNVLILVYDITNKESFDEIRNYWINQVKEYAPKDVSKKNIYI